MVGYQYRRPKQESAVEDFAVKYAKGYNVLSYKLFNRLHNGWPDRAFFLPGGRVLLIEFKTPGEDPRKLQNEIHEQLRTNDYEVHVCDNIDDFKRIFTEAMDAAQVPKNGRKVLNRKSRRRVVP